MRIVAGKYRSRKLQVPKDQTIRPTSEKLRAAVFNILNNRVEWEGLKVLDMFCGTGAMGIEALSRGAEKVVFMDNSQESIALTKQNLAMLGEDCKVELRDSSNLPTANEQFDIIFVDPPYKTDLASKALVSLRAGGWISKDGIVVVETGRRVDVAVDGFEGIKEKIYGTAKLILLGF